MSLEDFARYIDKIAPEPGPTVKTYAGGSDCGDNGVPPAAGPGGGDGRRRVLVGIGVLAVLVVIVAAVAMLSGRGADDSTPVVAGPGGKGTWIGPVLLAPMDVEWTISSWEPAEPSQYRVEFEYGRYHWGLSAVATSVDPGTPSDDSGIEVGGRHVYLGNGDGLEDGSVAQKLVHWTEPGGTAFQLGGYDPALVWPGAPEADGSPALPSTDLTVEVVGRLREVTLADWTSALTPPDGVPDPTTGAEDRPLRLGLSADRTTTALTLAPWSHASSDIELSDGGAHVRLDSFTTIIEFPVQGEQPDAREVTIRGVEGHTVRVTSESAPPAIPIESLGGASSGLTWQEGRTVMALWYPSSISDDEAIEIANLLTVRSDEEWEGLLYPPNLWDETPPSTAVEGTTDTTAEVLCPVLSAATDIPAGTSGADMVNQGMVEVKSIPAKFVPSTAITDMGQLAATSATTFFEIKANTVLVEGMVPTVVAANGTSSGCGSSSGQCLSDSASDCVVRPPGESGTTVLSTPTSQGQAAELQGSVSSISSFIGSVPAGLLDCIPIPESDSTAVCPPPGVLMIGSVTIDGTIVVVTDETVLLTCGPTDGRVGISFEDAEDLPDQVTSLTAVASLVSSPSEGWARATRIFLGSCG